MISKLATSPVSHNIDFATHQAAEIAAPARTSAMARPLRVEYTATMASA